MDAVAAVSARHPGAADVYIAKHRIFSFDEEQELCRAYVAAKERNPREADRIRAKMVAHNQLLVASIARRYSSPHHEFADFLQEGNIGLMKALERFEPSRGFKFATYATWWIRQAITRSIADHKSDVQVPVYVGERMRAARNARTYLAKKLLRQPTLAEVADFLEVDLDKIEEDAAVIAAAVSLNSPTRSHEENSPELIDVLEDTAAEPATTRIEEADIARSVVRLLSDVLDPRSEKIMRLRMGIGNRGGLSLEEIGEYIGLTRERIRQIEVKSLARLRFHAAARGLKDLLDTFTDRPPAKGSTMDTHMKSSASATNGTPEARAEALRARIKAAGGLKQGKPQSLDVRRDVVALASEVGAVRAAELLDMRRDTIKGWAAQLRGGGKPGVSVGRSDALDGGKKRGPAGRRAEKREAVAAKESVRVELLPDGAAGEQGEEHAPVALLLLEVKSIEFDGFGVIDGLAQARYYGDGRLVLSRNRRVGGKT